MDSAPPHKPAPTSVKIIAYSRDAGRWLFVADLLGVFGTTLLLIAVRRPLDLGGMLDHAAIGSHVALIFSFVVLLLMRLGLARQYEEQHRFQPVDDMLVLVRTSFMAAAVAVFLSAITKGWFTGYTDYSRAFVAAGFLVPTGFLALTRVVGGVRQRRAFDAGNYLSHALLVGGGTRAADFAAWLASRSWLGIHPTPSSVALDQDGAAYEEAIASELDRVAPDQVVLAFDSARPDLHEPLRRQAAYRGIMVRTLPGVFEHYPTGARGSRGVPEAALFTTSGMRFARAFKTVIDRTGAALGLLLISPVFALVALCIWIEDRGPVFYRQERIGYRGRRFLFWKFRSMRNGGDAVLEAYLAADPEARAHWDAFQKLEHDPRVTRVGRFLRRSSIDELPQLLNVLVGDMSLVGPRPPIPNQLEDYGESFVFSQARPGMTGLWQVSGRNEIDFGGRVDLDVFYVENWSFWLDVRILLRTASAVVRGSGAY